MPPVTPMFDQSNALQGKLESSTLAEELQLAEKSAEPEPRLQLKRLIFDRQKAAQKAPVKRQLPGKNEETVTESIQSEKEEDETVAGAGEKTP